MGTDEAMRKKIKLLLEANQARLEDRWEDAVTHYLEFIDEYGEDVEAMWGLASSYFNLRFRQPAMVGLDQQALCWIDKAIEREPDRAEFYVTRGEINYIGLDAPDYARAETNFRAALELEPDLVSACFGISGLESVPGAAVTLSEAIVTMEHASAVEPENALVFLVLGTLYNEAGRIRESYQAYKRALVCPAPLSKQQVIEIYQRFG